MKVLTDFAGYIFHRVTQTADEVTPDILDWKPVEEANSIYWILVHMTRIAYLLIPQLLTGTYNPEGWDDDYEQQKHSLSELRDDLAKAKTQALSLLNELNESQLEEEIVIWGSKRLLKEPVFVLLGELLHHNGQISMLIGMNKRANQ
ncbi:MAG: DinB family protein [Candidatus Bathyarchaeota archaeon]|nr:DinB family protein [Candidatus Bathyarchaeota archaeon]